LREEIIRKRQKTRGRERESGTGAKKEAIFSWEGKGAGEKCFGSVGKGA